MPDLVQVLGQLPAVDADRDEGAGLPAVLVDHAYKDDAAVVAGPSAGSGLVLTADVIAPLVDDPATFGEIAATNAISDVYAMGGTPRFALNLAFFPDDQLGLEVLAAIQAGAGRACARAGVAVVGGHTVRDPEVKFGLSVTGEVALDRIWSNRNAAAGDVLVLSKALGTGVIGQAIKQGAASAEELAAAIASMTTSNRVAMEIGQRHGVRAATDVTGFGLAGHLRNLLRGSRLSATVRVDAIPVLPGVRAHIASGRVPGGSRANRTFLASMLVDRGLGTRAEEALTLVCDAQTSGGLLLCVPAASAGAVVAALVAAGAPAAIIGALRPAAPDEDEGVIALE